MGINLKLYLKEILDLVSTDHGRIHLVQTETFRFFSADASPSSFRPSDLVNLTLKTKTKINFYGKKQIETMEEEEGSSLQDGRHVGGVTDS